MKLADFDFDLPRHFVAQNPVTPRDSSRLLHMRSGGILDHLHMRDFPELLRQGDVLVINDSKVIKARLYGKRGNAKVEILLHKELSQGFWEAFARPARRLKAGQEIIFAEDFSARVEAVEAGGIVRIAFLQPATMIRHNIARYGLMPLPPYIKRGEEQNTADEERYQTVYAREEGSVAAPTAGLHFTPELLQRIQDKGIKIVSVTLHVGAGTFQPVKTENIFSHIMHAELAEIPESTVVAINEAKKNGGRVIAVGTTSARALETVADEAGRVKAWQGETRIFIHPGVRFQCVDALLTNFHLPKSTLFMLVAAFSGLAQIKTAYAEAMAEGYRFFSYGDACFLEKR